MHELRLMKEIEGEIMPGIGKLDIPHRPLVAHSDHYATTYDVFDNVGRRPCLDLSTTSTLALPDAEPQLCLLPLCLLPPCLQPLYLLPLYLLPPTQQRCSADRDPPLAVLHALAAQE